MTLPTVEQQNTAIGVVCDVMKEFLMSKNVSYNGSVFTPLTYNGKTIDLEDSIDVRIVDKIRRMMANQAYGSEDTEKDHAGYLIIKQAVKLLKAQGYYADAPTEVSASPVNP